MTMAVVASLHGKRRGCSKNSGCGRGVRSVSCFTPTKRTGFAAVTHIEMHIEQRFRNTFLLSSLIQVFTGRRDLDLQQQLLCKCDPTFRRLPGFCQASALIVLQRMAAGRTLVQSRVRV